MGKPSLCKALGLGTGRFEEDSRHDRICIEKQVVRLREGKVSWGDWSKRYNPMITNRYVLLRTRRVATLQSRTLKYYRMQRENKL